MEDKHYAELANIRLERAGELVSEAEMLLYCRPPGFTVLYSFMHLAGALQSELMLKM